MSELIADLLLLFGATFLLLAAIGLVRMPDLFMRMSSATKGTTFGIGLVLLAAGFHFPGVGTTTRAAAGILFFFVTTPVAAHMIARAAYFIGVPLWDQTVRDDLRDRYDPDTHGLEGHEEGAHRLGRLRRGPSTVIRVRRPMGSGEAPPPTEPE